MLDLSLLDEIFQNLEHNQNRMRIKKLILFACKKRWINDLNLLNSISLKNLVQELFELTTTVAHLKYILYGIVIRLNNTTKYTLIADIIVKEMEKLYPTYNEPARKVTIVSDSTGFLVPSATKDQEKLVILELEDDNVKQGIQATLEIVEDNNLIITRVMSWLPSAPEILKHYDSWQSIYRSLDVNPKLGDLATKVTNISSDDRTQESFQSAQILKTTLTNWYNSEEFSHLRETLQEELDQNEEIRLIIRTENHRLWQLPWNLVFETFLNRYPKAEVAMNLPEYKRNTTQVMARGEVKVLGILDNITDINIELERKHLSNLPNSQIVLLTEPLRENINNKLWEEGWSIVCLSGRSEADSIYLNKTESLNIWGLKYALTKAIVRGLKLAIFNCGDGLELARELASLKIPQIIVMRSPVPNRVAQQFLKFFLKAFSSGKSLYAAMREARERLQPLENEFPGVAWLPVICQTPTAVPLTWQECRLPLKKLYEESVEQKAQEPIDSQPLAVTSSDIKIQQIPPPPPPPPPPPKQTISYENIYLANTLTGFSSEVYSLAINPQASLLVSGNGDIGHEDNTIKIWNFDTGTLRSTLTGHLHWVSSVAITSDGKTLVSGSWDSTIKIWNLNTGVLRSPNIDHYQAVNSVVISPDGHQIVSGSDDKTIKIWDLATGALITTIRGHSRTVNSVAISPNGQTIVSGSDDKTIKIWNFAKGTLISTLTGHEERVFSIAISPDGQRIVSGSDDKTIKIWHLATGTLISTLTGHDKSVQGVAISPDGQTIVSCSLDKTIKIWNLATGTLISTLTDNDNSVLCVAISPDAQTIVSGSYGEIKIWRVSA